MVVGRVQHPQPAGDDDEEVDVGVAGGVGDVAVGHVLLAAVVADDGHLGVGQLGEDAEVGHLGVGGGSGGGSGGGGGGGGGERVRLFERGGRHILRPFRAARPSGRRGRHDGRGKHMHSVETTPAGHTGDHDHDHGAAVSSAKMGWAVGLTVAFVAAEAAAGAASHSLALVGDAGHNLADAAALGFSGYALWIARKPSHAGMTFGYHRVAILAALVNAVSLVGIAVGLGWGAVERLAHPAPAQGWVMVAVAAVAVALNFTIGSWLHAASGHDLNVRSARLHMLGDAVSAMGVVVAGLVVATAGWSVADPVVSLLIAGLILVSSWGVLKESVAVLLEAAPAGVDMAAVERDLSAVGGVVDVHDLHVWTVGPGVIAASVHVSAADGRAALRGVVGQLRRHGINHTTVQVHVSGDDGDDAGRCCDGGGAMYCRLEPAGGSHVGHRH